MYLTDGHWLLQMIYSLVFGWHHSFLSWRDLRIHCFPGQERSQRPSYNLLRYYTLVNSPLYSAMWSQSWTLLLSASLVILSQPKQLCHQSKACKFLCITPIVIRCLFWVQDKAHCFTGGVLWYVKINAQSDMSTYLRFVLSYCSIWQAEGISRYK